MKSYQKWICLLMALVMCMSLTVSAFAAGEGETPAEPTTEYLKENKVEGPDTFGTGDAAVNNDDGKITVTGAIPGETYEIYQIFYLVSYSTAGATTRDENGNLTGGMYNYKVNSVWKDFVATAMDDADPATPYFTVDNEGYVKWNGLTADKDRAAKFAEAALKYAKDNKIKPVATANAEKVQAVDENGQPMVDKDNNPIYAEKTTVVFGRTETLKLKLGYYLVDTSLGSLCSLDTTNPEVNMQEKNTVPTNEKTALEGDKWAHDNNAEIGSRVYFKSYIELESGTDRLVFHDQMTEGLTLVHNSSATTNADKITLILDAASTIKAVKETALVEGTDYEIVTKKDAEGNFLPLDEDGCTFHIVFKDAFFTKLTTGKHNITITYSAILNEKAVVEGEGNSNTSKLDYGNNGHSTPGSETHTKTWDIPVFKYTLGGNNNTEEIALAGAVFTLSDSAATPAIPVKLVDAGTDTNGWKCYRVATPDEIANEKTTDNPDGVEIITQITTDSTGKFRILGVDDTTYYLHEITAPTGYKALSKPIAVQVKNDGTLKNNETDNQTVIKVYNGTGSELPSTGGIGTTIFYVVGSVLLVGATVLLITKKRMSAVE